ncbi:hypothetical protein LRY60_05370 [Candidatus Woesebacteria bacterium]|nr:hypothetical protein [Candidatus Woesebacteria bacterium]
MKFPLLILICGGSGSGKSYFAQYFQNAAVLSTDDFYVGKSKMTPPYNFDVPEAFDFDALELAVQDLLAGKSVEIPVFEPAVSERVGKKRVEPAKYILVEGIFAFHSALLRDQAALKFFLDVPASERIRRRIERDTCKGRDCAATLQYSIAVEAEHSAGWSRKSSGQM